jgi:hypothetical protein
MIMMMIVMMMAMTPRIEARLSPYASHISCAHAGCAHEVPGKQRTPERRPAKLRLLEATVNSAERLRARVLAR